MTDNKSLTYLMQLEENTKSEFTEVKNKIDSIDLSIGDLGVIVSSIDEMKNSIDSLKLSVDTMYTFVNETNTVVKDIYTGNKISEWIDDLASYGSSSTTYNDSSRMNTLITNYEACSNLTIGIHLFNWSLSNNKLGTFMGTALQDSSIAWSSLTTSNSICANSSAFYTLCGNTRLLGFFIDNPTCKSSIWNNRSTVESGLSRAYSYLSTKAKTVYIGNSQRNKKWWVIKIVTDSDTGASTGSWYYTVYDTQVEESVWLTGSNRTTYIGEFISRCGSSGYAYGSVYYIEFS